MKSEDRIIELLSEYLKKTDQQIDRTGQLEKSMENMGRSVEIMSKAIAEHSIKFNQVNERLNEQGSAIKEMLKELVSLSKRVSSVEDKC